ncbi:beta-N-acetylhexosaminidase [Streptomyces sp. HPF1205]|uniref:beta-N-acetylhexosaminidase n=1 Tax=Streptomyces sp. HPF1205 TaxID=2873262 RepID=UPI001CEC9A19|nr:beta-N-acetylhexosaminidase [Streptomyces sp. HPF1205]
MLAAGASAAGARVAGASVAGGPVAARASAQATRTGGSGGSASGTGGSASGTGGSAVRTVSGRVIPVPAAVRPGGGAYRITADSHVVVAGGDARARRVAEYAAGLLRPATGYALPVETGRGAGAGAETGTDGTATGAATATGAGRGARRAQGIVLTLLTGDRPLGDEGYRLRTGPRSVVIAARTAAGLFHGVQTLRQLLPAAIESRTAVAHAAWIVPDADITDMPRYAYRGMMLDLARHFLTVAQVERYIDELARYKFDVLHLHLTDDQGWRIAIASWPRLASYGGSIEVGGGPGGYWTQADYREVVRYAADRFLTVVPEIDGPGHTNAALASYAGLNCDGVAPPLYTGTKVGFSSLCVGLERTYDFESDVLREVAALTPGPYLHIGGDEAHATSRADYVTFVDRVQRIAGSYGKKVIGWHQIDAAHPVPGALAQYWGTGGDQAQVVAAARAGTGVIMSPANKAYLDMKYTPATVPGLTWAGTVEVRDSYDWDPATYLTGMPAGAVHGVEAALWTETLATTPQLEYMTFPRLPGIAEIGWSPAATHDWAAYRVRLAAQAPRWTAAGIDYYRSPQVDWP